MVDDFTIPATFDEAITRGGREVSREVFDSFIKELGERFLSERLVDCTIPENDGLLCFHTTQCYKGQRAFRFCDHGLCQRTVMMDC